MSAPLLSKWIQRALAKALSPGDEAQRFQSLVHLARDLRKNRLFFRDPQERYVAFLTERYLLAVHGNLFMDTPFSEELRSARSDLLSVIDTALETMAAALNEGNHEEVHRALSQAVNYYLETIEKLNAMCKEAHLEGKGVFR